MKKLLSMVLIFISTLVFCDTVRIASGEWPPYISEKLEHYGFISQIVTEAFEMVGFNVEYGFYPWKRSYELAKSGEWDCSLIWSWNEERDRFFYFSSDIGTFQHVIMYRKSNTVSYKTVTDLKGETIGGVRGYFYGEVFEKAIKDGVFIYITYNSDSQLINLLLKGRIDGFVVEKGVARGLMRNDYPEYETEIAYGPVIEETIGHLIFSKNKKGYYLRSQFEIGLKSLKESGRYDEIYEDYQ